MHRHFRQTFYEFCISAGVCYFFFVCVCVLVVCRCHMVLIGHVVFREEVGVFSQSGSDPLLLLESARVGDLDVAALGGRLVHNLLQPGIELAVCGVTAHVLVVRVAGKLSWDLIKDFGLRLLLAQEGQFPPGRVGHDKAQELTTDKRPEAVNT